MRPTLTAVLLTFLLVAPALAQTSLRVASVSPAPNAVSAPADAALVIEFDAPVDPAMFDRTTVMVLGRWSGVRTGTFAFENDGTRVRFVPARPFFAGERVTVSLARRLATPAGTTLATGYAWQFWIRTRPASLALQETARLPVRTPQEQQAGTWIQTYGAFAGDLDADGYTDLTVPNERSNDVRVFMNDGAGRYATFQTYAIPGGDFPSTNEGADFNLDGHLDLAVGNSRGNLVSVFLGDGTGRLAGPQNVVTREGVRGLTVLDADGDGWTDIATAHRDAGRVMLLTNDGNAGSDPGLTPTFSTSEIFRVFSATAIAAADADRDGVLDLLVGAFGTSELLVFFGDGDGGFRLGSSVPAGGPVWMIATGDVDGDGNVDVVSANSTGNNASILRLGDHGQILNLTSYPTGGFPLAIDLGDLDGDGDLDLVTSNFADGQNGTWTLYENAGDGTFTNRRDLPAAGAGSCAVLHDRDADGTLDMTGIDEVADLLFLFTNTPVPTHTEAPLALVLDLQPPYPNPATSRATVAFHFDAPTPVRLTVYDVQGRAVRRLFDGSATAGRHDHTWDGRNDAGRPLPPGLYFFRLQTPTAHRTHPLIYQPAGRR